MNKTRKGFLTASAILTIIAAAFALIGGVSLLVISGNMSESLIKEALLSDGYEIVENGDNYYFFDPEEGEEFKITDDLIKEISELSQAIWVVSAVVVIGFSVAKLVLSIKILSSNNVDKYSKGCVIALLVINIITACMLEAAFLIVAMCLSDKKTEDKHNESKEDIIIE